MPDRSSQASMSAGEPPMSMPAPDSPLSDAQTLIPSPNLSPELQNRGPADTVPAGPGNANICRREYIYYLPHPMPPDTKLPYTPGLPKSNPLGLPKETYEPTHTIVLTSPNSQFLDIRVLKPIVIRDVEALYNSSMIPQYRIDWGFAGSSHSENVGREEVSTRFSGLAGADVVFALESLTNGSSGKGLGLSLDATSASDSSSDTVVPPSNASTIAASTAATSSIGSETPITSAISPSTTVNDSFPSSPPTASDPETAIPDVKHSTWTHWVDSRHPVGSPSIPLDTGLMFPLAPTASGRDRTLEFGSMRVPTTGVTMSYEELWADLPITACFPSTSKMCITLRLDMHVGGVAFRGFVIRLGAHCQGIMQAGDGPATVECWEFREEREDVVVPAWETNDVKEEAEGRVVDGDWVRTGRIGSWFLPCAVAMGIGEPNEEVVGVGMVVRYGLYEWRVEECVRWV